ncbi:UDP-N-acetylmuramate dehydrogenase [Dyadobacter jejuensis]|uniref:UDP-N-acetylenolpyruvoylglucosamine reductase n=1 Tax=Dyadobacter jejuensis TaxID=1082580 RepID=A0A316AQ55_9BACT|nr:UDP-N-acetylmuramate dehydrogenase [Dyadobacter jejuensis]PWJ59863.1 UDP-N-acetylmuramate dehydrogenase [Dyadobacter jejuensis]
MLTNASLLPYNTFGIAAQSKYLTTVTSEDELGSVLADASFQSIDKLLLGGGSNVLFTADFEGLVILNRMGGITLTGQDQDHIYLRVGAGEVWHDFVMYCVENGYAGIENLSLIPGTVGAAPMQNIGAYGVEVKEVIESVEAMSVSEGTKRVFSSSECQFGYRDSIFKRELKGQYMITAVNFRLNKHPNLKLTYGDIEKILDQRPDSERSIRAVSEAVIAIRQSKLPDPAVIGNAGSFFKNPEISNSQFETLKAQYPTLPGYPLPGGAGVKVPAGWLIEQSGWKGYREGSIGVHDKQALVLVHFGGGTGAAIKNLSERIQASVSQKFGIALSPEVNFIG